LRKSGVFCSSAKTLHAFIKRAREQRLIPPHSAEFEDATLVSKETCQQKCQTACCSGHPQHALWLKQWKKQGRPIPEEITTRFNNPWS